MDSTGPLLENPSELQPRVRSLSAPWGAPAPRHRSRPAPAQAAREPLTGRAAACPAACRAPAAMPGSLHRALIVGALHLQRTFPFLF